MHDGVAVRTDFFAQKTRIFTISHVVFRLTPLRRKELQKFPELREHRDVPKPE